MSADHDKHFIRTFTIVLGILFAFTIVAIFGSVLITQITGSDELRPEEIALIQTRTDPVYRVITDPSAAQQVAMTSGSESGGEPKSAEAVFQGVCAACHTTGVAGAPKVTNTAEWSSRLSEKGLETLYNHAINGFKAMPAKGGNPALSDKEVKKTVDYILSKAGAK